MSYRPLVSIGLPVWNGQRYLRQALDGILSQTFADFELIISDNASTDGTEAICREYCGRDKRIQYARQSENIGAAGNFNRTFELSCGKYFKWIAHDDQYAPGYLAQCVQFLESDPSVVLCHCVTGIIDEAGERISSVDRRPPLVDPPGRHLDDQDATVRLNDLLLNTHWCFEVFGLMRREIAARTPLHGKFYGGDKTMLAHLILEGRFYEVPEVLFFRRYHEDSSTGIKTARAREAWVGAAATKLVFPRVKCMAGYAQAIVNSPLTTREKWACFGVLIRWGLQLRKWQSMIGRKRSNTKTQVAPSVSNVNP